MLYFFNRNNQSNAFNCNKFMILIFYRFCSSTATKKTLKNGASAFTAKGVLKVDFESLQLFKDLHSHLCVPQFFQFDINISLKELLKEYNTKEAKQMQQQQQRIKKQQKKRHGSAEKKLEVKNHLITTTGSYGFAANRLGMHVKFLRKHRYDMKKHFKREDILRLQELGFIWEVKQYKFQLLLRALRNFHRLYETKTVPTSFVVPRGSAEWDKELWGYRLGQACRQVRDKSAYGDMEDALRREGFVFDSLMKSRADNIKLALSIYQQLYGKNYNIMNRNEEEEEREQDRLEVLAYPPTPNNQTATVLPAIKSSTNKKIVIANDVSVNSNISSNQVDSEVIRHLISSKYSFKIPRKFKVPMGDKRWPKRLWGMKLGYMVHNIRYNGYFRNHLNHEDN